ncbi:MAG: hypothetical protein P0S94_01070 [Simkaniaceae bacterium]|nr:hypothetical protein [Simkaniaceae bacterium]
MLELNNPYRKNKINLADYDYQKDIQNRMMMARLSPEDLEILEEILYSPPKLSIAELVESVEHDEDVVRNTLEILQIADLFNLDNDTIIVNKEMRKYFETQILKFEEGFTPGMEFLQALLRKVPIHVLPTWYPIPRTSDNIFEAIVEKYLVTPQTYHRYLMELNFGDEVLTGIVKDVFEAEDFRLPSEKIFAKYNLSPEQFEECMLYLEFNFVCCLVYTKKNGKWQQVVTPFHEWREYLRFGHDNAAKKITDPTDLVRYRPSDFAFVDDITALLDLASDVEINVALDAQEHWIADPASVSKITDVIHDFDLNDDLSKAEFNYYFSKLIKKILFLKLAYIAEGVLKVSESTDDWLNLQIERRALSIYKHTIMHIDRDELPADVASERSIHEIEKALPTLFDKGWIYYDDFFAGLTIPLSEESRVTLKKVGRYWRYTLPNYSDQEQTLIRKVILEWLFEAGIVAIATHNGKQAFRVTALGEKIFG